MKPIKTTRLILLAGAMLAASLIQTHAAPGDVDLTFDPGSSVNGFVRTIAVQPDGKVLIGGDFTTAYEAMCTKLARLNADGSVDKTFIIGVEGPISSYPVTPTIMSIALQNDGKILIGGVFTSVNGTSCNNLARLNSDGSLDESFLGGTPDGNISSIVLVDGDKILIQGDFTFVNGIARPNLARLNTDGSLDPSFQTDVTGLLLSLALQGDGKILIGGQFTAVDGISHTNLARLNADGTLDSSFTGTVGPYAAGFHTEPTSIAWQSDGKVLIAGYFGTVNGVSRTGIVRLNADGTTDDSFAANLRLGPLNGPVIALQADGKILVGGNIYVSENGAGRVGLARFNLDGTLDTSFIAQMVPVNDYAVLCMVPRGEGEVLVGGGFQYMAGEVVVRNFCQIESDGSPDLAFGWGHPTGPNDRILSVAVQPDGRVLIGGLFASVSGSARGHFARLMPDGSLDNSFLNGLAGANSEVHSVVLQSDGKILIGGWFSAVNGIARGSIARLNADGTLDSSFLTDLQGANSVVESVVVQSNGQILIGGWFTTFNGVARGHIARLNADGTLDSEFMNGLAGADYFVVSITLQPDGKILIGGSFSSINELTKPGLARLNPNGSLDTSFIGSVDGSVDRLGQQSDGRIVIAGSFTHLNGVLRTNLARIHANGALDESFLNGLAGPNSGIASLAIQADNKVLIGEYFTTVNGVAQSNLARLNSDGTLDRSFAITTDGANFDRGPVEAIVLEEDANILIAGDFTVVNQTPRSFVARLLGDFVAPYILVPPQSQTAEIGSTVYFSAFAAGFPTPKYQWLFNASMPIGPLTTNSVLELANVQLLQSGTYSVVVTNSGGSVTSTPAMLNVIMPIERRIVPAVKLLGAPGSLLRLEYLESLDLPHNWQALAEITLSGPSRYYFDLQQPLPPQRFMRVRQELPTSTMPDCQINLVPALTLAGMVGTSVRVDYINQIGPTEAWVTLDTVTLTNTSQLYFDVSAPGQPSRLYRLVLLP